MSIPRHALAPDLVIPRHHHALPYAALVLRGGYEEAGDGGRFRVSAGDVLVHAAFSSHLDRTTVAARVLNLPLPLLWAACSGRWRVADPDACVRTAERDPEAAAAALLDALVPGAAGLTDEPDALAGALMHDHAPLAAWSSRAGVARQTTWRWFVRLYGVAPSRFRSEARTRRAWRRVMLESTSLSEIAIAEGFADQAHMTRSIRALTGRTPGAWRQGGMHHSFKTGAG